jgi:hypothetical protein
MRRQRDRKV